MCLFAGYNYNNIISNYVVKYLEELNQYCDIYYCCDNIIASKETNKIAPFVKKIIAKKHGGYDFYSWKLLINDLKLDFIAKYDELILANDSCLCVNSFSPIFNQMDDRTCDLWGLVAADEQNISTTGAYKDFLNRNSKTFYIGSYFLAFRKTAFLSTPFKRFIDSIKIEDDREKVCNNYEYGLIYLARQNKWNIDCWDQFVWRYSSVYMRDAFNIIKNGCPLLKVRLFTDNIGGSSGVLGIAQAVEPLCDFKFMNLIDDIRKERGYLKLENNTTDKKTYKYLFPPIIITLLHGRTWKIILKYLGASLIPQVVKDITYNLTHFKSIRNTNRVKFTLKPRPRHRGWLPEQIVNYRQTQDSIINELRKYQTILVFFNVMREGISGGMLSINRFAAKSNQYLDQNSISVQSNLPLTNACILNPYFEYDSLVVDFNYLCGQLSPHKLILNIPECFVPDFLNGLDDKKLAFLYSVPDLRINILNQNDELMPNQSCIEELRSICNNKLTITAAHDRYATNEKEYQYSCPVFLLTPFLPKFPSRDYSEKENIIVLSPDKVNSKEKIISLIKNKLPKYKIITVKNMTINEYIDLICRAKFTISFGEGWDGYFLEPYLCDSIAFTVYNHIFFPNKFNSLLPCVYQTWAEAEERLVIDIKTLDDKDNYRKTSKLLKTEIKKFINNNKSESDLKAYLNRFGLIKC